MGCHGRPSAVEASESTQAQLVTRTRAITNEQVVEALKERGSLNGAAAALGINQGTILNRARSSAAIREALGNRTRHTRFVDMTGQQLGDWKVLREVKTANGNSRWECEHKCGGVEVLEGIKLRHHPNKYCHACRPKPPGTVTRIAKEPADG